MILPNSRDEQAEQLATGAMPRAGNPAGSRVEPRMGLERRIHIAVIYVYCYGAAGVARATRVLSSAEDLTVTAIASGLWSVAASSAAGRAQYTSAVAVKSRKAGEPL